MSRVTGYILPCTYMYMYIKLYCLLFIHGHVHYQALSTICPFPYHITPYIHITRTWILLADSIPVRFGPITALTDYPHIINVGIYLNVQIAKTSVKTLEVVRVCTTEAVVKYVLLLADTRRRCTGSDLVLSV